MAAVTAEAATETAAEVEERVDARVGAEPARGSEEPEVLRSRAMNCTCPPCTFGMGKTHSPF